MAWTAPRTWAVGETLTAANFNTHIRDNLLAVGPHLIVRKPSDESVTSSTVLQDDDSLVLTVAANEVWQFKYNLRYEGGTAGGSDLKISWSLPASGRVNAYAVVMNTAGNAFPLFWDITTTDASPGALQTNGGGVVRGATIEGWFINAGTAGNYTLRWAQNSSSATATKILANSTLWGVKLA